MQKTKTIPVESIVFIWCSILNVKKRKRKKNDTFSAANLKIYIFKNRKYFLMNTFK